MNEMLLLHTGSDCYIRNPVVMHPALPHVPPLPQSDALVTQHLYMSMKEQKVKGIVQVMEVVV